MKALDAHFDGTQIVLDEPFQLAPNTKLKVVVMDEIDAELSEWSARLSEAAFARIWDNPRDAQYDKF